MNPTKKKERMFLAKKKMYISEVRENKCGQRHRNIGIHRLYGYRRKDSNGIKIKYKKKLIITIVYTRG